VAFRLAVASPREPFATRNPNTSIFPTAPDDSNHRHKRY
jgi:hypothetical protein